MCIKIGYAQHGVMSCQDNFPNLDTSFDNASKYPSLIEAGILCLELLGEISTRIFFGCGGL